MTEATQNPKSEKTFLIPVYHSKKWVYLPARYIPKDVLEEEGNFFLFGFQALDPEVAKEMGGGRYLKVPTPKAPITEILEPSKISVKVLLSLCRQCELPLSWVTGNDRCLKRDPSNHKEVEDKRKVRPLSKKEYKKWLSKLKELDEQAAVIAEILWFLNKSLRGGTYVSISELLLVRLIDVKVDEEIEHISIELRRYSASKTHMIYHYLPEALYKRILERVSQNPIFLFSNKYEGPLSPVQVDRLFKKAGLLAGFPENQSINSLSLRPTRPKRRKKNVVGAEAGLYRGVRQDEWLRLLKAVPDLISGRGRKAANDPKDVLNAILYHLRTSCPIRKLPQQKFPPWSAVSSQYGRWRKSGLWGKIRQWLKDRV